MDIPTLWEPDDVLQWLLILILVMAAVFGVLLYIDFL